MNLLAAIASFIIVVESGSIVGAAKILGVSAAAVSQTINRLETHLGVRLLQRTTRKLRLSEGGEEVFKRCQEMVSAARSVMEISGQFTHEAEGLVRVSVPKAVGRFVVHPHMPEFLRRYPKVDVQLILEDRQVDMIDDNVDLSIRITDSKKDMIVVSGFKVFPNEIEDVLTLHPGVLEAAAVGVRDERSGEAVKVVIVRSDPDLTEADVLAHCKQHLTGYKMPRVVAFRSEPLPKTNIGKILRRELRDSAAASVQSEPPTNA